MDPTEPRDPDRTGHVVGLVDHHVHALLNRADQQICAVVVAHDEQRVQRRSGIVATVCGRRARRHDIAGPWIGAVARSVSAHEKPALVDLADHMGVLEHARKAHMLFASVPWPERHDQERDHEDNPDDLDEREAAAASAAGISHAAASASRQRHRW